MCTAPRPKVRAVLLFDMENIESLARSSGHLVGKNSTVVPNMQTAKPVLVKLWQREWRLW